MTRLRRIQTRNYRSLADVTIDVGAVTVLFGPNGAGKSTFFDALCFVCDSALNGVEVAAERREHGIGMLWDGADERHESLGVTLTTDAVAYGVDVAVAGGRILPRPREVLYRLPEGAVFIGRSEEPDWAVFRPPTGTGEEKHVRLREPGRLSLGRYLDEFPGASAVEELDRLLRATRWHHSRSFLYSQLKRLGSQADSRDVLAEDGRNLWSVLRNLSGRRSVDDRYDTILALMREGFPDFRDLVFEQIGTSGVYGSLVEAQRRRPTPASGTSDGHLQLLLMLTALFGGEVRESVLLLDEPEISLHPWPITVLGRAVRRAAERGRQVMIATHSPVLLSQFEPEEILGASLVDGRTQLRRVSEMAEVADLLDKYAVGSLYMAEAIAPQSAGNSGRG